MELDPLDSRAHLARAWALCLSGGHGLASVAFELARSCNANDPWAVLSSALGAAYCGDQPLAERLAQRVLQEGWTTQRFQWGFHAPIRFLGGDYAGCADAAEAGGDAILNLPGWQAAALWHLGDHEAACSAWQRFENVARMNWASDELSLIHI